LLAAEQNPAQIQQFLQFLMSNLMVSVQFNGSNINYHDSNINRYKSKSLQLIKEQLTS
jgi:hypothetical protein